MAAFAVQVATRLSVIYLFGGSFNKVHCRYNRIVQPVSCFRVPPHGFFPDPAFGLPERRNGNRGWRAAPSWSTGDGMSGVAHCCADPTTLAQAPISEFGFKNQGPAGQPPARRRCQFTRAGPTGFLDCVRATPNQATLGEGVRKSVAYLYINFYPSYLACKPNGKMESSDPAGGGRRWRGRAGAQARTLKILT